MVQVIKLERSDDVRRVHSEVKWSDGQRVILVVPRRSRAFESQYGPDLVRRWADDSNVQVGLVTGDLGTRERAAASGLLCFSTIESAQQAQWRWPSNGHILSNPTALDDEVQPGPPLFSRLGLAGRQLLFTLLLFSVAIAGLGVAAVLLVPSANITVVPAALTVSDTREVILDPTVMTIDQINGIIPTTSYRREISGTASIATTKLQTAPADRASGEVIFTNLTGNPAAIPAGTIVETSSGVTVRFSTAVTSALASGYNARVTVPIVAVEPGPEGNIKPLQVNIIEGPLSAVARVINARATSGGTIKQVHVVTLDDKSSLRQRLGDELRAAAVKTLGGEAGTDYIIPPASIQVSVVGESFDHLVDDPAESLSLHVEGIASGAAVDPADLRTFGQLALGDKVPKGYSVLPGTLSVEPDTNARVEANSVILTLVSSEQATPVLNGAQVLKGVNGKPVTEAEKLIASRVALAAPPRIEVTPAWWQLMPYFDFRIAFFVQPESGALSQ